MHSDLARELDSFHAQPHYRKRHVHRRIASRLDAAFARGAAQPLGGSTRFDEGHVGIRVRVHQLFGTQAQRVRRLERGSSACPLSCRQSRRFLQQRCRQSDDRGCRGPARRDGLT